MQIPHVVIVPRPERQPTAWKTEAVLERPVIRPAEVQSTQVTLPSGRARLAVDYVLADQPTAAIVLSHGYTGSKEDFWAMLPLLAERGLNSFAFDKRGQNESASDGPFGLDDYALDTIELSNQLPGNDARLPVHLLGHSWGGLEAARVVVGEPSRFASVTFLCTGPAGFGDRPERRQLADSLAHLSVAELWEQQHPGGDSQTPVESFLKQRFLNGNRASLAAMTEIVLDTLDQVDAVHRTGVPALVFRGEADDAWPHEVQDDMADRLGTTVQVVPGAHSPNFEAPAALVDALVPRLPGFQGR